MKDIGYNIYLFEPDDYAKLTEDGRLKLAQLQAKCRETFNHLCDEFGIIHRGTLKVGLMSLEADCPCSAITWHDAQTLESEIYFDVVFVSMFFDRMLAVTAPHEAAHAFCDLFDFQESERSHHGKLWQETMQFLGLPTEACFYMTEHQEKLYFKSERAIRRGFHAHS